MDFPQAADRWGVSTAAAAFVLRRTTGKYVAPIAIDEAIGRKPESATSGPELSQWLLDQGLRASFYSKPEHPMYIELGQLDIDELTFEQFIDIYGRYFSLPDETADGYGNYMATWQGYFYSKFKFDFKNKGILERTYPEQVTTHQMEETDYSFKTISSLLTPNGCMFVLVNDAEPVCVYKELIKDTDGEAIEDVYVFIPAGDGTHQRIHLAREGSSGGMYKKDIHDCIFGTHPSIGIWHNATEQ